MKCMIWGAFSEGEKAVEIIKTSGLDIEVVGFIDRDKKKWDTKIDDYIIVDPSMLMVMYKKKEIDKIVIPSFYQRNLFRDIIYSISELDIDKNDVIVPPIEFFVENKISGLDEFLTPWFRAKQLDYVEFAVTDKCNLNCKRCARFAPLVKENNFDHEKNKKDFTQIKKYITHISMIRLLGGEPFLDPDIDDYFVFLRNLYPHSEIRVVTNGLNFDKLPDKIIDSMKMNNVKVDISYYPPLKDKIDLIKQILEKNELDYEVQTGEVFYKSFDFKSDDSIKLKKKYCKQWCISLNNGRLFPCATSACFGLLANKFDLRISPEKGIDLYSDSTSVETIKSYLSKPIPLCQYCNFTKVYLWEPQGKEIKLSDWDMN